MKTYAIGDLHGRKDLLLEALDWIQQDAAAVAARVVFVGDYIDRGPASAGVIEHLIELSNQPGNIEYVFLKGNHEDMLMDAILYSDRLGFMQNGGVETMKSYGFGVNDWHNFSAAVTKQWDFFKSLRLYFEDDDHIFVHAGIDPTLPMTSQRESVLLWVREPWLEMLPHFYTGKRVIHGHTPTPYDPFHVHSESGGTLADYLTAQFRIPEYSPVVLPHRINLDTLAFRSGILTVVALNGMDEPRFYQTGKNDV